MLNDQRADQSLTVQDQLGDLIMARESLFLGCGEQPRQVSADLCSS